MKYINPKLAEVLLPAYAPCIGFKNECLFEMRWKPEDGHVPRGFCGGTGPPEDIKLVLVCAEPGDPHTNENHESSGLPIDQLYSAYTHAYECFKNGKDLFHQNIRHILNLCLPDLDFDQQMEVAWITESILCSAQKECGSVPMKIAKTCRRMHLEKQLMLMPNAVVIALGGKAKSRLKGVPNIVHANAAAPPGCNQQASKDSWVAAAKLFRTRQT